VAHAGATLGKGLNRGFATFLAGVLGLGSYYIVHLISSGNTIMESILLGIIIFLASNIYWSFFSLHNFITRSI
jgi:hypothetical protein